MNRFILPLLAAPIGFVAGVNVLARAFHDAFGAGSHMDMSGLLGALIGAPLGAALGTAIGFGLGVLVDRRTRSCSSPDAFKRVGIPWAIGMVLSPFTRNQLAPILICAWLGLLAGGIWNFIKDRPRKCDIVDDDV